LVQADPRGEWVVSVEQGEEVVPVLGGVAAASFAAGFPDRFSAALDAARGVREGIEGATRDGMLNHESLRCYQEIYRLRVELELESAAFLWRAAEAVCALSDAAEVLSRMPRGGPALASVDLFQARREAIPARQRPPVPVSGGEPLGERETAGAEARPESRRPGPEANRSGPSSSSPAWRPLAARSGQASSSESAWDQLVDQLVPPPRYPQQVSPTEQPLVAVPVAAEEEEEVAQAPAPRRGPFRRVFASLGR
jgi:hypothetical protein